MGQPLMPWQEQVALVGGEIDPDTGLPAYREVAVTVPRQSGKTTLILAWQVQRALGWGRPQRIVYSAQTGNDARKKLIEDQFPILEPRQKQLGIARLLRGMGNESVEFLNGSRITLLASSEDSGHGKTLDLAVKDELFADTDDRRDQAMIPAMATRPMAQMLTASTAGTDLSLPLNRLVQRGRDAAERGLTDGLCYFEWSAPDGADLDDEELWWSFMPALGHTQTPAAIRHASGALTEGEFRRAFGNIPTRSDERLIPAAAWDVVCGPEVAPTGRLVFGVDVNEERSSAAVVAVGEGREVEVVEHRSGGIGWLPERIQELDVKWPGARWAWDAAGPAGAVFGALPKLPRRVFPLKGREFPEACGQFLDDVAEAKIRVRRIKVLDEAVIGVRRSFSGDVWKWVRRDSSVDITPLVAATVGLWVRARPVDVTLSVW